ncbi:MAG TPA: carboxypeptidase-like regulatory domain-containing protein, partial [Acidobacteriaceae bacterium]|nr:carboxypeptidase-like regulatory domain-containing protein [Acidobacteriaceae bacterium]
MKNYRFSIPAALLLIVVSILAINGSLFAQTDTSSLSGTVTDATGAVVPDAKVTARNNATLAERAIGTNAGGEFTLTNLAPGDYTVRVEKSGFETTSLSDVRLDPNIGRRIDVSMKIGATTTEVTVQAGVNTVQT